MSNVNNVKWENPWKNKIKEYYKKEIEIDKLFKKGETKPDGTVVSSDTGETIKFKVNEIENLLNERDALITDLVTKQTILKVKKGYLRPFAEVSLQHDKLEPTIKEYKDNLTSGKNYTKQYNDFFKPVNSTATDAYRTDGWIKRASEYTTKPFTPPYLNAEPQDYTNLYEVLLVGDGSSNSQWIKMTEQEMIKFITLSLKEYEKIDTTTAGKTFNDFLTSKKPSAITINYESGEDAGKINGYLTTLKTHAKKLVKTADTAKGAIRDEYTFGHNCPADSGTGMKDTIFGKTELEAFFKFTTFLSQNYQWLNHKNIKENILKDISRTPELTFIPADDANPWKEKELYGWHEAYLDKKFEKSDTATGFYKDIPKKEWANKAIKHKIEEMWL